ncbi:MAG: hypothetical protein OHK0054_12410 [Sideroxydans sp.]
MLKKIILVSLASGLCTLSAQAAEGKLRLDAHASTLGGGLEIGTVLTEQYSARLGFNKFSFSTSQNSGGLDYKGDLKLSSIAVLADYRPFKGTFHLTGGAVFNSNKFSLSATTTPGTYTFNGTNYTSPGGDSITSSIEFNKVAPYLGLGWSGHPKNTGLSLSTDIGILFQGSPKASVTTGGTWGGANTAQLAADSQAQLNSDLSGFKFYPVLSLGIGYTF